MRGETYPETATQALSKWDRGESVWAAEMGGLGPGYEQCIHIAAFEFVRELLKHEPIDWTKADALKDEDSYEKRRASEWGQFTDRIEKAVMSKLHGMGMSGAQLGAAQNLAYIVVRKGWRSALLELPDDRMIQVSNGWPKLDAPSREARRMSELPRWVMADREIGYFRMETNPSGDWVRYADHEAALLTERQRIDALKRDLTEACAEATALRSQLAALGIDPSESKA